MKINMSKRTFLRFSAISIVAVGIMLLFSFNTASASDYKVFHLGSVKKKGDITTLQFKDITAVFDDKTESVKITRGGSEIFSKQMIDGKNELNVNGGSLNEDSSEATAKYDNIKIIYNKSQSSIELFIADSRAFIFSFKEL
ncbi:hypothetical protein EP073_07835 [Geovibrio thiophilus]|uniref:Uncharacterized protein n=1 Tax=Geovibrio thiophilus TaxID=139438 RepID=A0A3R5V1F6_9BACT|nr:hypothetical protein [Geovibrio thiophilus]QAR33313.1 hypothetical protein EP073_07835 [Geovibrio thiophilus]